MPVDTLGYNQWLSSSDFLLKKITIEFKKGTDTKKIYSSFLGYAAIEIPKMAKDYDHEVEHAVFGEKLFHNITIYVSKIEKVQSLLLETEKNKPNNKLNRYVIDSCNQILESFKVIFKEISDVYRKYLPSGTPRHIPEMISFLCKYSYETYIDSTHKVLLLVDETEAKSRRNKNSSNDELPLVKDIRVGYMKLNKSIKHDYDDKGTYLLKISSRADINTLNQFFSLLTKSVRHKGKVKPILNEDQINYLLRSNFTVYSDASDDLPFKPIETHSTDALIIWFVYKFYSIFAIRPTTDTYMYRSFLVRNFKSFNDLTELELTKRFSKKAERGVGALELEIASIPRPARY